MATFLPPSSSSNYPSKFLYLQSYPSLFFLILLLTSATSSLVNPHSVTSSLISYPDHCNHIVPETPIDPSPSATISRASLAFDFSFFSGGESLFNRNQPRNSDTKSARFRPKSIRKALGKEKIYKVEAKLILQINKIPIGSSYYTGDLGQRKVQITQIDSIPLSSRGGIRFDFTGFWSESTGKVCMIGSTTQGTDSKSIDARLLLNYSIDSNIYGSLIKGMLESVNSESNFEKISILGVKNSPLNYEYKLLDQSKSNCGSNSEESLSLENVLGGMCQTIGGRRSHMFGLNCGNSNSSCSPIRNDPSFMSVLSFLCDGERMQMVLSFSNTTGLFSFDPNTSLVAEGSWDVEKKRFCGVACKVSNFSDSLSNAVVEDCSVRLSLRFPAILSIKSMAPIVGQLWSDKTEDDPSYFRRIEFSSLKDPLWCSPSLRYKYTETERVNKLCGERKSQSKSKRNHYPDAQTSDMSFYMSVKEGNVLRSAFAKPYFVGDRLSRDLLVRGEVAGLTGIHINAINSFTNITYRIHFMHPVSESRGDIYAEGTYDKETGDLCMIGCQSIRLIRNKTMDCSLAIKMKFSPIDSRSDDRLKGTIESTREKSDPLYVSPMEVSSRSIYAHQAKESIWRMDFEVAMVLISNTLSCLFVGMQLYHMKKHQEAIPYISIVMLILLILGHMIPLLLNFEELFKSNHKQESLFFDNDKWLEAKEIVVRIVTMIAFLLECRLLQLAWTVRKTEEHNGLWNAEKKVSYVCVPLYIFGGLIAWLVNRTRKPKRMVYIGKPKARNLLYRPVNLKRTFQRPSLWKDLKSYGGLMLDAFLLPQILFNGFIDSDSKTLAVSFYGGNSIVRLLPHGYDLYRSYSYGKILDWSFIYANHKMDYYSTAWDIIILCIGFVFAVLIFLQQRFGGRCFILKRFRENVGYEKVVELQEVSEQHNDT